MYRTSGEGKEPVAPALLAMVLLLQAYTGASDAQAVELAIVDARWQMVLGVLGDDERAVFAGRVAGVSPAPHRPRHGPPPARAHRSSLPADRRVRLEEAAQGPPCRRRFATAGGAGRVEDTFNLLAHAARNVLVCAAR